MHLSDFFHRLKVTHTRCVLFSYKRSLGMHNKRIFQEWRLFGQWIVIVLIQLWHKTPTSYSFLWHRRNSFLWFSEYWLSSRTKCGLGTKYVMWHLRYTVKRGLVKRGCQTLEIQYTAKSHHQQELFLSQGLLETNLTWIESWLIFLDLIWIFVDIAVLCR